MKGLTRSSTWCQVHLEIKSDVNTRFVKTIDIGSPPKSTNGISILPLFKHIRPIIRFREPRTDRKYRKSEICHFEHTVRCSHTCYDIDASEKVSLGCDWTGVRVYLGSGSKDGVGVDVELEKIEKEAEPEDLEDAGHDE